MNQSLGYLVSPIVHRCCLGYLYSPFPNLSSCFDFLKLCSNNSGDKAPYQNIFASVFVGMSEGNIHQGFAHSIQAGSVRGRNPNFLLFGVSGKICLQAYISSWSNHPYIIVRLALIWTSIDDDRVRIFPCHRIAHCCLGVSSIGNSFWFPFHTHKRFSLCFDFYPRGRHFPKKIQRPEGVARPKAKGSLPHLTRWDRCYVGGSFPPYFEATQERSCHPFPLLPSFAPWAVLEQDLREWFCVRLDRVFPSRLGLDPLPGPILGLGAHDPLFVGPTFLRLTSLWPIIFFRLFSQISCLGDLLPSISTLPSSMRASSASILQSAMRSLIV